MHHDYDLSIRRIAVALAEPAASTGRWANPPTQLHVASRRKRPVSDRQQLRNRVLALADHPRHRTFGYRRIRALLRRENIVINNKTVRRIMREMGLSRPRRWRRPSRPFRVEKMRPSRANRGWQIDMTSFMLSDMTPLFMVTIIDCCTREIVGWTLDRRCRAGEWIAAVRMALESRGLMDQAVCRQLGLVLRSDNGSQPCSKKFVAFLRRRGLRGQYTGYGAPDDNAYVERVIRTIKEEEIWPNLWDTVSEAREAIDAYVKYYNEERIHSSLGYQTPNEVAAALTTHAAA